MTVEVPNTQVNTNAPLVVSIGEPAGIGADVLLRAVDLSKRGLIPTLPEFVVVADLLHLSARADLLSLQLTLGDSRQSSNTISDIRIVSLNHRFEGHAGTTDPRDAAGVIKAIQKSVSMVKDGTAAALVTLPINKEVLYQSGFEFPGHTEFLGHLAESWPDRTINSKPVMMLASPLLRVVPLTIHIPLAQVAKHLTTQLIVETCQSVATELFGRCGIEAPRLAIAGLNPHAGEGGAIGNEDISIIQPAVDALQSMGIHAVGPLPADTMFHEAARENYDAAICMYHDQALIPAKALAFDDAVNVTLGLPFIRTSPDHGTALDIAGTGKANPTSFIAALRMASDMVNHEALTRS